MFSRMQLLADSESIAHRFRVLPNREEGSFFPKAEIIGFEHATHPLITTTEPHLLSYNHRWGLVPPNWNKPPEAIRNHTLCAKLEYLDRRYSWSLVLQNRCLVPATAYFEYHWNDPKGKSKTKYQIRNAGESIFALAGLFSVWTAPDGSKLHSFAVCTTVANEVMEYVHNKDAERNYHRMPVMLNWEDERAWLDTGIPYMEFSYPNYRPRLKAEIAGDDAVPQFDLFA